MLDSCQMSAAVIKPGHPAWRLHSGGLGWGLDSVCRGLTQMTQPIRRVWEERS